MQATLDDMKARRKEINNEIEHLTSNLWTVKATQGDEAYSEGCEHRRQLYRALGEVTRCITRMRREMRNARK